MWTISTKPFVVVSLLFVTGCCHLCPDKPPLTRFPIVPETVKYTQDPVLQYNEQDKTYVITSEYMLNSLQQNTFTEEILKWRRDNGIR